MTAVARIFAPLLLWLALFSGVYGLHGIGCGLGWPNVAIGPVSLHRGALVLAWIGAILLQTVLLFAIWRTFPCRQPFVQGLSLTLALAALAATVWTLFPASFASSCG